MASEQTRSITDFAKVLVEQSRLQTCPIVDLQTWALRNPWSRKHDTKHGKHAGKHAAPPPLGGRGRSADPAVFDPRPNRRLARPNPHTDRCTLRAVGRHREARWDAEAGEWVHTPPPTLEVIDGGITLRGRRRGEHPAGTGFDGDDGPEAV